MSDNDENARILGFSDPIKMTTFSILCSTIYILYILFNVELETPITLSNEFPNNFFIRIILSALLNIVGFAVVSSFTNYFNKSLPKFTHLFSVNSDGNSINNYYEEKEKIRIRWQNVIVENVNRNRYYILFTIISILGILFQYNSHGNQIMSEYGFIIWLSGILLMFLPTTFIISRMLWLILAIRNHVLRFTMAQNTDNSDNIILLGRTNKTEEIEISNNFKLVNSIKIVNRLQYNLLPIRTKPRKIYIDLFHPDNQAGLSIMLQIVLRAIYLLSVIGMFLIPFTLLSTDLYSYVGIPVIVLYIIYAYTASTKQMQIVIDFAKDNYLKRIIQETDHLGSKITSSVDLNSEETYELFQRFQSYNELRDKIHKVATPKSLKNVLKFIPSTVIPALLLPRNGTSQIVSRIYDLLSNLQNLIS